LLFSGLRSLDARVKVLEDTIYLFDRPKLMNFAVMESDFTDFPALPQMDDWSSEERPERQSLMPTPNSTTTYSYMNSWLMPTPKSTTYSNSWWFIGAMVAAVATIIILSGVLTCLVCMKKRAAQDLSAMAKDLEDAGSSAPTTAATFAETHL